MADTTRRSGRTGRPPLDPRYPTVQMTLRVTSASFDELCRQASRDRTTLAATVRRRLDARDDDDDADD